MIDTAAVARGGRWIAVLALALPLAAHAQCAKNVGPSWQDVATRKDIARMRQWRSTWVAALTKARTAGNGTAIDAEAALLDPDAGLYDPMPPAGDYSCRAVRFGEGHGAVNGFAAVPTARCRIKALGDGLLGFAQLDGTERPVGRIYPGEGSRLTFLGTLSIGDESRPFAYGVDEGRDLIGYVERVGPSRWRLDLPFPPFSGAFEVLELVPAGS